MPYRLRWFLCAGVALVGLSLLGYWVVDNYLHGAERAALIAKRRAIESVRNQISNPADDRRTIRIDGRYYPDRGKLEAAAFLAVAGEIKGDFALRLSGVPEVEEFLRQIHGFDGLKALSFDSCAFKDLDTAMETIATIPHLEVLSLSDVCVTSEGLAKLKSAPRLNHLWITYAPDSEVTISDVLALPHLRKLGLAESHIWKSDQWLRHTIDELPDTLALEHMTLCRIKMQPEEVKQLRKRYPFCAIDVLDPTGEYIAPYPKNASKAARRP